MNRVKIIGVISILVVLIFSCSGNGYKYVNASVIEVEYYDTIKVNEWILIDGIKFEHKVDYETIKADSTLEGSFYEKNILPATTQDIIIEAGESYEVIEIYDDATMVDELFKRLAMMSDDEGNRKYSFLGNSLTIATGKLRFRRVDGEKIKISTSDAYGAAVRKIE